MIRKLLLFIRSLFLFFSNSSKERSFTPSLRMLCLGMFFVVSFANGATITSTATGGNWNAPATWAGGVVPLPTDIVVIASGANVLANGNQTCGGLTITGRLTMINNEILTVNGNVSGGGNWTTGAGSMTISLTGNWSFTGTSSGSGVVVTFTGGGTQTFTGRISSSDIGTLRINKSGGSVIMGNAIKVTTFTNTAGTFDAATYLLTATTNTLVAGTLRVGASTWGGNYSFIPTSIPSDFTIEYDGGNQTVNSSIQYQNLAISGSGTKTVAGNITVNNDFSLSGGTFVLNNASSNILTILGDYNQTGGVFYFNSGDSGTSVVNLAGNFSNTAAGANSITTTGNANNGILYFNGTGTQTINTPTPTSTGYVDYNVKIGSTLKLASNLSALTHSQDIYAGKLIVNGTIDFGIYTFTAAIGNGGSVKFLLNSGATLITANSGGTDGSVLAANMTRTFDSGANYTFNGTVAQTTSASMPATVNNLTISNTHASGVTLSKATTVSKNFSIATGSIANLGSGLVHNTSTLTLGGEIMIPGSWGSTGSSATNKNNTYFVASASGIVRNNCTSPTISSQPQALTICEGAGGTFSVTSSTSGVTYQWQYSSDSINWFNIDASLGASVAGYTTNSLTLSNTPVGWNGYRVRCVVRNNLCAANSNPAQLTVNFLPTNKTIAAESSTVCSGSGTNITVSASQSGVSYQLRNASNGTIGSAVLGNGGLINLATGNLSVATTFNVLATNSSSTSCFVQMGNTVTVTVNTNSLTTQVGTTSTFCTDNLTTYTTPVATPGQYALVNVIKGFRYDFSVGDAFSGASEVLTILDASSNTNVSPATTSNGPTGAVINNWISSLSGQIKVVLTTLNCAVSNTVTGTSGITITQTATGNQLDSQLTAGTNNWVGHIYNAGGGQPTPFTNANYMGYYTIGTENFDTDFGGDFTCIPVLSNGTQRASIYSEGFAVRYRMNTTKTAGCYFIKVTGDDGVRLSIDGGSTYVFDSWVDQSPTTYDYIIVNLPANPTFILDYYENGTNNRVSFDIIPFNAAANTITAPSTINFCDAGDPAVIGGSMQYTSADPNVANPYVNFQWQRKIDSGTFANIAGETGRTYDPPALGINATANNIVYQYQRLATINTTKVPGATCSFATSNIVTITHRPNASIASVTGATSVCISGTTTYTANTIVAGGGTGAWSSSAPTIATVDASGLVRGVSAGTADIIYTISGGCGASPVSQQKTITVNPNASIASVTGANSVCISGTTTYTANTIVAGGGTGAWSSSAPTIATVDASGLVRGVSAGTADIIYTITGGCGASPVSQQKTITVIPNASIALVTGANSVCISGTTTYTANSVVLGGGTGAWSSSAPSIAAVDASGSVTGVSAGSANIVYTISGGCGASTVSQQKTITVNALPSAPTVNTTQPTCAVPKGTITITNTSSGSTYSIDGSTYTNTDGIFSGLDEDIHYNVTIKNSSGCISPVTDVYIEKSIGKHWTGATDSNWSTAGNWSPLGVPGIGDCVIIPDTRLINKPVINSDITAYSFIVEDYGLLTVNSDKVLTVSNGIIVGPNGTFVFENNSSLLQLDPNASNVGNITYKRNTTPVRRYDYTRWSSPVTRLPLGFTLHDLSPDTLGDKYWSYTPGSGWTLSYGGGQVMEKGIGYNVRAPQTFEIADWDTYTASFIGTPNNGDIEINPVVGEWNLIGNPYPSTLLADKLIDDNLALGTTVGAIYLWTHNTSPVDDNADGIYTYTTDDYAIYSKTGGIATRRSISNGKNTTEPNGKIAAGQGFFVLGAGKIKFTNSMRLGADNNQFFKISNTSESEKNRVWLNFTNAKGAFKQLLVGYIEGATNNWDVNYDAGTMSSNTYVDFYSINETDRLSIQGRAVPFANTDEVPLGYVTTIAGDFTISIDHVDGLFTDQEIYLEDKVTGKEIDLRAGNYTFTTAIGTFTDRFVLRYTSKTLGTGDFENLENGIFVSVKNKVIKVQSSKEPIKEVTIFDISGKLLYNKKKVSSTELQIPNLNASNEVLLVKVTLENGFSTAKKVIFQ